MGSDRLMPTCDTLESWSQKSTPGRDLGEGKRPEQGVESLKSKLPAAFWTDGMLSSAIRNRASLWKLWQVGLINSWRDACRRT